MFRTISRYLEQVECQAAGLSERILVCQEAMNSSGLDGLDMLRDRRVCANPIPGQAGSTVFSAVST